MNEAKPFPARCGEYEAWAQARIPTCAEGGETLFCAEPPPDFPAFLDLARSRKVSRFVCGFLADEVDCETADWRSRLEYFVERMEYCPFVLDGQIEGTDPACREVVVCCLDPWDTAKGASGPEAVANAWASAIGCPVLSVRPTWGEVHLHWDLIAGARGIVNGTSDWLVGFALDELAARHGRPVVRTTNPGYSPLRYALLGIALPPPPECGRVPELRTLLAGAGWLDRCDSKTGAGGAESGIQWRNMEGGAALARFWSGADFRDEYRASKSESRGWLHRPAAWAALAQARCDIVEGGIGRAAWDRAVRMMTAWLVVEQKERRKSLVREWAAGRWLRLFPEWLRTYQESVGNGREQVASACRWTVSGLTWAQAPVSLDGLITAAETVADHRSSDAALITLARAWRYDWTRVTSGILSSVEISRGIRSVFAHACWRSLETDAPGLSTAVAGLEASLWERSMGAAGQVLRLTAALRMRRFDVARQAWRMLTSAWGVSGIAGFGRIVRAAYDSESDWLRLIDHLAGLDAGERAAAVSEVLTAWASARRWRLWRRHRDRRVQGELAVAAVVERRLEKVEEWSLPRIAISVRLAAWTGSYADACAALREAVVRGGRGAEMASVSAIAFWLRSEPANARALLTEWPILPDEPGATFFPRALAHQLLGETDEAVAMLSRLRRAWPRWPVVPSPNDGHFLWGALVFKRAGQLDLAERLTRRAIHLAPACRDVIDETAAGSDILAEGWTELFASFLTDHA